MDTDIVTEPWLLTVAEVAVITRKSQEAVRWAIRQGRLSASKPEAGSMVITRQAVANWLGLDLEDIRSRCSEGGAGQDVAA